MIKLLLIIHLLLFLTACDNRDVENYSGHKAKAEKFFRGVYGCNPSVVDDLAADTVIISYPIFRKLYNTSTIRGKDKVREFAETFCSRWSDAKFTFHEIVEEEDKVVLVWSFSARFIGNDSTKIDSPNDNEIRKWGGLTFYRFNEEGKIIAEIGEESTPGPFERFYDL